MLNKAEIDRERALFQSEALRLDIIDEEGLARDDSGDYIDEPANAAWKAWQAARAITPPVPACLHRVADIRNPVVKSGYMCIDCGALFAAADHDGTPPAPAPSTLAREISLIDAQLDRIARSYFADLDAQEKVKNAIHDAFLAAVPRQAAVADEPADAVYFVKSLLHPNGWHECSLYEYKGHVMAGFEVRKLYLTVDVSKLRRADGEA